MTTGLRLSETLHDQRATAGRAAFDGSRAGT
jgi:hypothetical protein